MTKYLKAIDFIVISTLILFGIASIGFGIAYDSYLYKLSKDNRITLRLYDKEIIKTINKNSPREVFGALLIVHKYNAMMLKKKITFHMFFIIGLVLCFFSIFYFLSSLLNALTAEISSIKKYIKQIEDEKKEQIKKTGNLF